VKTPETFQAAFRLSSMASRSPSRPCT